MNAFCSHTYCRDLGGIFCLFHSPVHIKCIAAHWIRKKRMLCTKEYNTLYLDAQPFVQDVKKLPKIFI